MKEGTDVMEHLTYMISLAEQFRELKEEITPQRFATVILGSLQSLNATKMDELKWDNVKGLLMEEYKRREEKHDNNSSRRNEALIFDKGNFASSRGINSRRGGRNFGNTERFR